MRTNNVRYRELKVQTSAHRGQSSPTSVHPQSLRLVSQIAAPDAVVKGATNLGVLRVSENLGVTGLALVCPSLGLRVAGTVETGKSGDLAEPSSDEDVLELVGGAGSEDLTVATGVKLVDHLAVALGNTVQGVGLELGVLLKGLETQLLAPLVNNSHVAGVGGGCLRGR